MTYKVFASKLLDLQDFHFKVTWPQVFQLELSRRTQYIRVIGEEMRKNLTAYSTSQNKKKVYAHEGNILKIEGATDV